MATVVRDNSYHERRLGERRRIAYPAILSGEGMKVSWGGIFGGVLVAVGLLLLLSALGVAVGVSALQPGETQASTLGAGAGIWAGVSLLVALFVGGMVSTRIGAIFDGTTGFFEGALVWVVSVLLMLYMAGSGVGIANIDPTGGVHPDQFWQADLGNIRSKPFSKIWTDGQQPLLEQLRDRLPLLKGRCGRCAFKAECGGSFRARAIGAHGDPWAEDPACYLTEEEITRGVLLGAGA